MSIAEPFLTSGKHFVDDIKIEHSVFALPFAFSSLFFIPSPTLSALQAVLILVAMVAARSFAMGFNRLVDRNIDRQNQRTATRKMASGELSTLSALFWLSLSGLIFILAAHNLRALCGQLAPIVLLLLGFYSYLKRFTEYCHLYLGFCLSLSPLAVSLALGFTPPLALYFLSIGIIFWVAGFDMIYAMQDSEFDRRMGLHSVPSRFGDQHAVKIAACSYGMTLLSWTSLALLTERGSGFFATLGILALIFAGQIGLTREQVKKGSRDKIDFIFFRLNTWVGVLFLIGLSIDVWYFG